MHIRRVIVLLVALVGLLLATWIAAGQQVRRVDDLALRNAGKTGEEWLTYGLTPGETRYSPLKQIDTTNVSRLDWHGPMTSGPEAAIRKPLRCSGTAPYTGSRTGALCLPSTRVRGQNAGDGIRKSTRSPCGRKSVAAL